VGSVRAGMPTGLDGPLDSGLSAAFLDLAGLLSILDM
jgi:hypothetical protein